MKNIDALICVAGWEDRFAEGLKRDIASYKPKTLMMLVFEEFSANTQQKRTHVLNDAWFHEIDSTEVKLRRTSREVWATIRTTFDAGSWNQKNVVLDISTMPREVIWWTLTALAEARCNVQYVYYHPERYSTSWLTRDTATPRLVYQHSGLAKLGKATALLLLNGFDHERAAQLVQFFEPRLLLLGLQVGDQFDNRAKNSEQSKLLQQTIRNIVTFELDAFSSDCGYAAIKAAVEPHVKEFNVVAASLGPKTSAIALFQLAREFPDIALAYAPSRQFNPEYSSGVGPSLSGDIKFD